METPDAATTGALVTKSLDRAVIQIERHPGLLDAPALFDAHYQALRNTRALVQKVRYQEDLQVPHVIAALVKLGGVIDRLVARTAKGSACSVDGVSDAMDEVEQAAKDLSHRLPGDINVAEDNTANGGFQVNAAIGVEQSDRRKLIETRRNMVTDAIQINAPIYGNAAFLAEIAATMGGQRQR